MLDGERAVAATVGVNPEHAYAAGTGGVGFNPEHAYAAGTGGVQPEKTAAGHEYAAGTGGVGLNPENIYFSADDGAVKKDESLDFDLRKVDYDIAVTQDKIVNGQVLSDTEKRALNEELQELMNNREFFIWKEQTKPTAQSFEDDIAKLDKEIGVFQDELVNLYGGMNKKDAEKKDWSEYTNKIDYKIRQRNEEEWKYKLALSGLDPLSYNNLKDALKNNFWDLYHMSIEEKMEFANSPVGALYFRNLETMKDFLTPEENYFYRMIIFGTKDPYAVNEDGSIKVNVPDLSDPYSSYWETHEKPDDYIIQDYLNNENDLTVAKLKPEYRDIVPPNQQALIDSAGARIGLPYSKLDCSAFVKSVFGEYGFELERVSNNQAKQLYDLGYSIPIRGHYDEDEQRFMIDERILKPGDLIFYKLNNSREGKGFEVTHVAIYAGNGQIIHSIGNNRNRGPDFDDLNWGLGQNKSSFLKDPKLIMIARIPEDILQFR